MHRPAKRTNYMVSMQLCGILATVLLADVNYERSAELT